jgi:arsenite methyltransferase
MTRQQDEQVKSAVREAFAQVAEGSGCGCGTGCCGSPVALTEFEPTDVIGYAPEQTATAPEGADLGLSCGNPHAIASLRPGETVLDLGSGAGIDCFIAARAVGEGGQVIGVDMTPEMVSRARRIAAENGYRNVEFRLGEIEHLPVADESVDVIISNCVINLSPDKARVFAEAFRVLKPGGRVAIADIVATAELPDELRNDPALLTACVAGAARPSELQEAMVAAGFRQVSITPKEEGRSLVSAWAPGRGVEDYVTSAVIEASKTAENQR